MLANCPQTCDSCPTVPTVPPTLPPATCEDKPDFQDGTCASWKGNDRRAAINLISYEDVQALLLNCPKTCDSCPKGTPPPSDASALMTDAELPDRCQDDLSFADPGGWPCASRSPYGCVSNTNFGKDSNFRMPRGVVKRCPRACQLCTPLGSSDAELPERCEDDAPFAKRCHTLAAD